MKLSPCHADLLPFARRIESLPIMKTITIAALLVALATPALAQQKAKDHSTQHQSAAASTADMTEGEIRKVDKDAKKLTIRHGEIKNLDMPPMTMVFQVKDASVLDKVKVGDKVRFVVQKSDTGFVVTDIEAAK